MKFKAYKGQPLKGFWEVSYKIDGVHVVVSEGAVKSKRGKPLYNMDHLNLEDGRYEMFKDNWETSVSMCRTQTGEPIDIECMYPLDHTDYRLSWKTLLDPNEDVLDEMLQEAIKGGYEGLILTQGDLRYKVKPVYSVDVEVTGITEGTGKHLGKLGAFETPYGNVGTGLKDAQRVEYNTEDMIGELIEVEFMEWTPSGKFRHPRFVRVRWDKDEVNLEE